MAKARAAKKSAAKSGARAGRKARAKAAAPAGASVGLPLMPKLYGLSGKNPIAWSETEERLAKSRNYWICTARPDGRPHSAPVWGFWMDGAVYFGTGRETRKGKNLAANPAVSIHLESGDEAVILEGVVEEAEVSTGPLRKKLDAASKKKYKMPLYVVPESVIYRVKPRLVMAWSEKNFPNDATKWEFEEG